MGVLFHPVPLKDLHEQTHNIRGEVLRMLVAQARSRLSISPLLTFIFLYSLTYDVSYTMLSVEPGGTELPSEEVRRVNVEAMRNTSNISDSCDVLKSWSTGCVSIQHYQPGVLLVLRVLINCLYHLYYIFCGTLRYGLSNPILRMKIY